MAKMMTKLEAYRLLCQMDGGTSWIANVFMTGGGPNCAKNLKAMVKLIQAGKIISPVSFLMPYERLAVDGTAVTPEQMRAMADGRDPGYVFEEYDVLRVNYNGSLHADRGEWLDYMTLKTPSEGRQAKAIIDGGECHSLPHWVNQHEISWRIVGGVGQRVKAERLAKSE